MKVKGENIDRVGIRLMFGYGYGRGRVTIKVVFNGALC